MLFLLAVKSAMAQQDVLSFDEHNRYIYYEVVHQPGLTADTFQNRVVGFLKAKYPKNSIDKTSSVEDITGTGKLLMLTGISAAKHIDGEIRYIFRIEYKDQKYRFWLTDFVFTPYYVDRYGNSVPKPGINVSLEDGASKLEKGKLVNYSIQISNYSKQFGERLKHYMLMVSNTPVTDSKKRIITTKNW